MMTRTTTGRLWCGKDQTQRQTTGKKCSLIPQTHDIHPK